MSIRDQIVGFLMSGTVEEFSVESASDAMVGAVSNLVLPAKAFRRSTQNDPVGVTRRAATLGLNEMRITGQLRVWNPSLISMFGTDKFGGEVTDEEPDSWLIKLVLEGYHLSTPRAAFIQFRGVFDEFPEITLAPDQEETPVPFGVDVGYYAEWYNESKDINDQTFTSSKTIKMFEYNANALTLRVRRGIKSEKMTDLWAHRKFVLGISV